MKKIKLNQLLAIQLIGVIAIFGFLEFLLIASAIHLLTPQPDPHQPLAQAEDIEIVESALLRRRIDGLTATPSKDNLYPVAASIDNFVDSRPNYGLSFSSIVYEMYVENDATRFLAIYTPDADSASSAEKIGPIRSARPYFLNIIKEYDALFSHSGGSPAALADINQLQIHDMDEIAWWGPDYYWRVYSRSAPHNLFTSEKNLRAAVLDWSLAQNIPSYRAWQFNKNIYNLAEKYDSAIYIDFSSGIDYDVRYEYATSTSKYLRFQADSAHIDALTGNQIAVGNVIIQFTAPRKVLDGKGRIDLQLIGQGAAMIYRDGYEIKGSWVKRDAAARTIYFDNEEKEISFKPGNIWIAVMECSRNKSCI